MAPAGMTTMRKKGRTLFTIILFTIQCSIGAILPSLDSAWNRFVTANFQFLPENHIDGDLYAFFGQKNDYFKQWYYLASSASLSFSLLSYRNKVFSVWDFDFDFGMGQSPGNVVFDPMDINFGILPAIEFRDFRFIAQTGLDHRCFHQIDRKNYPTVYYNKAFCAVGSPNFRLCDYRAGLINNGWSFRNRISWYLRWGYFVKEFFELIAPVKINGENTKIHEFSTDLRYALYRRRSWIINAGFKGTMGWYNKIPGAAIYWRNDFSLESNLRSGIRGGMLFIRYTLDEVPTYKGVPRFSKDRLLQVGIKFYD